MTDNSDHENMAIMKRFGTRASATWEGRRVRETRPLARSDRRSISTVSTKTRQLNLKVTPEFYERVAALARNHKLSMPNLMERAIAALVERDG